MALILPKIKHEYIFKEDTEQQKESTFEQCLDEGKEAAYASIGTDPLDSTYIAAPDVLPDHIMEYTSTDGHDYLKTIELVWGYTIGIIATPVVLNADTGDILAEGNAVDSYTAPEGVNIKKGRWIRLSGNRNLHPSILRAVEMPEDVICLKDLCAAIQIDEKTGFTVEGFDSSHVINFDNAFQKAWINSEVTFDMSSCKTCKYMFNEGLIKDNSGELLTIQNMQPGTNCDYMFYNSYLYRIPEGIRQAGVGGVQMFFGAALGLKSGVDMNTAGYRGKLYSKMFCSWDNLIPGTNVDTQHNNALIDTADMIFDSTDTNIDLALNCCKGPIPTINYSNTRSAKEMYYDKSDITEITVDLSTLANDLAATFMFGGDKITTFNIIGNPETTRLYYSSVSYSSLYPAISAYSLIRIPYFDLMEDFSATINITNTLYFYQYEDIIQGTSSSISKYTLGLLNVKANSTIAELKITGTLYALLICSNLTITSDSNIIVKQYHIQSEEEFKNFYNNKIIDCSSVILNPSLLNYSDSMYYDSYYKDFINSTDLGFLNLEDCFFIDRIFNAQIGMFSKDRGIEDNTIDLTIDIHNKSFCITNLYNPIKNIKITNAGELGFMYYSVNSSIYNTTKIEDYDESLMMKSLVTLDGQGTIYYYYDISNTFYYRYQYYSWQFVDAPSYNIQVEQYLQTLLLKSINSITNIVAEEYCTLKTSNNYPFNVKYNTDNRTLLAVDTINEYISNQVLALLASTQNTQNITLQNYKVGDYNWYIIPAGSYVDYNRLQVGEDVSCFTDFPSFNISDDDYALYTPISVNALNIPISMLEHFAKITINGTNRRLSVTYPLDSFYTLKHDVDELNVVINKFGNNQAQGYKIVPSLFEEVDLRNCVVGNGTWGNDSVTVGNGYYSNCKDIYVPNFDSISVTISTNVRVLNTEITFHHKRTSTSNARSISICPSVYKDEDYINGAPNLTTINFTGYTEYSLQVDLAHQHTESNLTTINWSDSYVNGNGNIDLRWSQGINSQTLQNITDLKFRGTNKTVTINTNAYKLFTDEQKQTLASKVTLNEYIPQEGES